MFAMVDVCDASQQGRYFEAVCTDVDVENRTVTACFPPDAGLDDACFKIAYDVLIICTAPCFLHLSHLHLWNVMAMATLGLLCPRLSLQCIANLGKGLKPWGNETQKHARCMQLGVEGRQAWVGGNCIQNGRAHANCTQQDKLHVWVDSA